MSTPSAFDGVPATKRNSHLYLDPSQTWDSLLATILPADVASEYAAQLARHAVSISDFKTLSHLNDQQFSEMGIRVGHRCAIKELIKEMAKKDVRNVTISTDDPDSPSSLATNKKAGVTRSVVIDSSPTALTSGTTTSASRFLSRKRDSEDKFSSTVSGEQEMAILSDDTFSNPCVERTSAKGIKWVALFGERSSAEALYKEGSAMRKKLGFPSSFDRSFVDDGPMPFYLQHEDTALFLMRIPEDLNDEGNSVRTITNRAVIMVKYDLEEGGSGVRAEELGESPSVIFTYHRFPNKAFARLHSLWHTSKVQNSTLPEVLFLFLRTNIGTYKEAIARLQDRSEDLDTNYHAEPELCIEKLALLQKQGSVYERCLKETEEVMRNAAGQFDEAFEKAFTEMADTCSGLESKAQEVAVNANSEINLKMALDGYRSSVNLKYFTYLSIVLQPVAVATGWYGMNFENMPELPYENAYFIFCGCVGFVIITVIILLWRFETSGRASNIKSSESTHPHSHTHEIE